MPIKIIATTIIIIITTTLISGNPPHGQIVKTKEYIIYPQTISKCDTSYKIQKSETDSKLGSW